MDIALYAASVELGHTVLCDLSLTGIVFSDRDVVGVGVGDCVGEVVSDGVGDGIDDGVSDGVSNSVVSVS